MQVIYLIFQFSIQNLGSMNFEKKLDKCLLDVSLIWTADIVDLFFWLADIVDLTWRTIKRKLSLLELIGT